LLNRHRGKEVVGSEKSQCGVSEKSMCWPCLMRLRGRGVEDLFKQIIEEEHLWALDGLWLLF
jgi:hypothetical protein